MRPTATKNGSRQPRPSHVPDPVPITRRSGVTTGSRLYLHLRDRNSPLGRRLADLIALLISDLGGGDYCSEAEKALVRRAGVLILQCEILEERWATKNNGEAGERPLRTYLATANSLRRILKTLGLQRRARDITPTLEQYLAAKGDDDDEQAEVAE